MSRLQINRRRFIRQGAAVGAVAAATLTTVQAGSAQAADASTSASPQRSTKTRFGSIAALHGRSAQVTVDGGDVTAILRLHGFPVGYLPVVGERVVVSDRLGLEGQFQVLPLVRFVETVPAADGTVRAGRSVLRATPGGRSPKLTSGILTKVWISDSSSGPARIMWSRPASA